MLSSPAWGGWATAAKKRKGTWRKTSSGKGVTVYRKKVPGSKLFAFRGEYTASIHIGRLLTLFSSSTQRKLWVENYHSSGRLEKSNEFERVYWIRFNMPWPVMARDFVMRVKAAPNPATRTVDVLIKSVAHKKYPKNRCCVRGIVKITHWRFVAIVPKKGGTPKTRITVEVHIDPKGWLPPWLVNSTQSDWPRKSLLSLSKAAHRFKLYPMLRHWHSPNSLFYPKAELRRFAKWRKKLQRWKLVELSVK